MLTIWQLLATLLVFFMTIPGLALFYGGLVRRKNVLSIIVQCFFIASLMIIMWVLVGYSLSFGHGNTLQAWIGNFDDINLHHLMQIDHSKSVHQLVFMLYQMGFAIITPALIIGAFAERMKFFSIILFTIFWAIIVYYPICHWFWGGGWLDQLGVLDYAGGSVVHLNAGIAGVVAAYVLGKRQDLGKKHLRPHNLTMVAIGAGILWLGWFGFNSGAAKSLYDIGMVILNTQVAAAASALTWMLVEWLISGKPSPLSLMLGAIAGLVAITPACGYVGPLGAFVIGVIPGVLCALISHIKLQLHYDDALDAFNIHGVAGFIGSILTGIFVVKVTGGVGLKANMSLLWQLTIQLIGALSVIIWSGLMTYLILAIIDKTIGLRVCPDKEKIGLDKSVHGTGAYGD